MRRKAIAKWAGRLIGVATSIFFLAFLIGEGIDGLYDKPDPALYVFIPLFFIAVIGNVIAWVDPEIGGTMMIIGGICMLGFHFIRHDTLTALVYGLPFILTGILFLLSSQRNSIHTSKHPL